MRMLPCPVWGPHSITFTGSGLNLLLEPWGLRSHGNASDKEIDETLLNWRSRSSELYPSISRPLEEKLTMSVQQKI